MWPHEIDALYRWYCTLPTTIVLFGTVVAVIRARTSHIATWARSKRDVRFRFDENDVALLSPFLWLFGLAVLKSLSWLVGGFSDEGKFTVFYVFYGMASVGTVACLCVVLFYRQSMAAIDLPDRVFSGVGHRVDKFYRRHSSRWYFILPLTMVAIAIIAVEESSDFAHLYKWYYIGPATMFFFLFLAFQSLGGIDYYADEQAGYHLRRAETLSKWLTLVSLLLIVWISVYYVFDIEVMTTSHRLYAATLFYGTAIWTLCALLSTWLAILLLSTIYGSHYVKLRKLSNQLVWAARDQKGTVCYRIRKVGGEVATQVLVKTLHDPSMHIAARLAAARELSELAWEPRNANDQVWLAIGADEWSKVSKMQTDGLTVLLEVLEKTLYSPSNSFDRNQLSLMTIPAIKALGNMADPKAVGSLTRAVKLSYEPELDESRVPVVQSSDNSDFLVEVVSTRCEAANALRAIGPAAASCIPVLQEILSEKGLSTEVAEAVASALTAIRPT